MKDSSNFKSFKMKFQVEFYFQNFEKCKIPIFINFGFGGGGYFMYVGWGWCKTTLNRKIKGTDEALTKLTKIYHYYDLKLCVTIENLFSNFLKMSFFWENLEIGRNREFSSKFSIFWYDAIYHANIIGSKSNLLLTRKLHGKNIGCIF